MSTAVNGQGCNSSADRGSSTDGDGITFCVPDDEQQQRAAALISSSVSDERATTAEIDPSLSLVLAARAAVMAVTRTSKQRQRQNRAVASFPVAPGVIASIHRCGSLLHSLLERSTATAEQSSGVQVAEHPGGPDTPVTFFLNGQGCNSSADRGSSTDGDGITFCVPDDEQQQRAAALISSSVSDERATTAEIDPSLSLVLAARAAVMAVTRTSKQRQRQNRAVASFPVAPGVIASIHRCGSLLHSLLERSTATAEQSSGVQVAEHPGGPDTPVTFFRSTKRQLQRRG
nr:hypothetical protein Iba_chr13fCG6900 [Ipomoea batatas]